MRFKSISRIHERKGRTPGWLVRVSHRGATMRRFFNDRAFNGRVLALREAIAWRDQAEAELGKPRTDDRVVSRSRLGPDAIVGVRETTRDGRPVFEITWRQAGRTRRTTVSIARHGREAALERALQIRADWTGRPAESLPS